jgi:hypothetical protein
MPAENKKAPPLPAGPGECVCLEIPSAHAQLDQPAGAGMVMVEMVLRGAEHCQEPNRLS